MDRERVRAAYDTVAADYAALLPDTSFEADDDLAVFRRFVDLLPASARVVDAGCGAGRMIGAMADARPDLSATGVDLSPRMIAEARRRLPEAHLAVGDLADLPVASATADGVLAWYSIIHTPGSDLGAIAAEVARVLRPGGVVLAAFQSGRGGRVIDRAYGHELSLEAVLHEPGDVAAAFRTAGLTVVDEIERAARPGERHPQGFVLARR
ncbi:MAG: methyltransferase domain-containing protein [Microbacterium arborescens]